MAFQSDGNGDPYSQNDDITNELSSSFSSSVHLKEPAAAAADADADATTTTLAGEPLPASSTSTTSRHPFDTTKRHLSDQTSLEQHHAVDDENKSTMSPPFLSPETALHQQHQLSQPSNPVQRRLSTGNSPHGDGTASDTLVKAIDDAASITPDELMALLPIPTTSQQLRPLLIDIRHQPDYEDSNIRGSIHVNMPSLLLKRYRRGTVSNFSLESFITTPQGMEDYSLWMKQQQQLPEQTIDASSSSSMVVVYDDVMDTKDKTTSAWTLVGALSTFFSGGNMDGGGNNSSNGSNSGGNNIKVKVVWLQGGFTAFEQTDNTSQYLEKPSAMQCQQHQQQQPSDNHPLGFENHDTQSTFSRQNNFSTFWNNNNNNDPLAATVSSNNNSLSIPKVVPVLSRSATTFSSAPHLSSSNSNMQRRSSLFTLDTTNVRNKHRSPPQAQSTTGAASTFRNARRRRQENRHAGDNNNPSFDTTMPNPTVSAISRSTTNQQQSSSLPLTKENTPRIPLPSSTSSASSASSASTTKLPAMAPPPHTTGALYDPPQQPYQHPSMTGPYHANDTSISSPPLPPSLEETKESHLGYSNNSSGNRMMMDCDESFEDDGLESEQEPTPMTENEYAFIVSAIVPDFLYLGPEISTVEQMEGLKDRSIRRILNMAEECDDDVPGLKATFKYSKVAARDTVEMQNVESTLRKAVRIIDEAKKHHEAIYVHCKAGKSRSVAVILAYFVLSEHWSLRRAYKHVIKARPWVSPNIGFVAELIKLEESALGHASNFAGTDWHKVDITSPPSPASQKEIGMVQRAWRHSISAASTPPAKSKAAAAAAATATASSTSSTSGITGSMSSPASASSPATTTATATAIPTPALSSSPRPQPQQVRQHRYGGHQQQQQQHHHNRYTTT